ncbi:hypothetical protein [Foetidibacter luteolus]|uniref:hypothetical protein n=1 Tax=Foetidibacter luteolus TaxID=2608880 RepID=UPI00129A492A|nr:hypothetical protein [Foetidibacter luteolus]
MLYFFRVFCLIILSLFTYGTVLACRCAIHTTEEEYKRSELVVRGTIIGTDTVTLATGLNTDRHGIRYGKRRYSLNFELLLRVKVVVEKNFKSSTHLPDTIYVLTSTQGTACGYPFHTYHPEFPSIFYDFIIYGDRLTQYSIQEIKKRKRLVKQITRYASDDAFFTSRCRLTERSNEQELAKLEKLKS